MPKCGLCSTPLKKGDTRCPGCGFVLAPESPASAAASAESRPAPFGRDIAAKVSAAREPASTATSRDDSGKATWLALVGTASNVQQHAERRTRGFVRGLAGLLAAILLLGYLTTHLGEALQCVLPFAIIGILFWMLLSWIGWSALFGKLLFAGTALAAGSVASNRLSRKSIPALTFRVRSDGTSIQVREVHLPGHDAGVVDGDEIKVVGPPWMGRTEALWVRNLDSGRLLFRAGFFGLVFNFLIVIALSALLISTFVGSAG